MPQPLSKFAIRVYLVVFTFSLMLLSVWLLFVFPIVRQHSIASHLGANGAYFKWEVGSPWIEKSLGSYWCTEVVSVDMDDCENAGELLSRLRGLRSLKSLKLSGNDLVDDDLQQISRLTQLKTLHIENEAITDKGLAYLKGLKNLKSLRLDRPFSGKELETLGALTSLELEELQVSQVTAQDLTRLKQLPGLRYLYIESPVGDDWGKPLDVCNKLEYFGLKDASLSDAQLIRIVQSNPLWKITLHEVAVGDAILPSLAQSPGLRDLELFDTNVTYEKMLIELGEKAEDIMLAAGYIQLLLKDGGWRQFQWQGTTQIEKLDSLRHCKVCSELSIFDDIYDGCDLSFLPDMPILRKVFLDVALTDEDLNEISRVSTLNSIILSRPQEVTPKGITGLRQLSQLQYLALSDAGLDSEHFKEVARLKRLTGLSFHGSKITSNDVAHLCELQDLEFLRFVGCESLDDSALRHVSKLNSLTRLKIDTVPITDQGLLHLLGMPNLETVNIARTECTEEGQERLQKMLSSYEFDPFLFWDMSL